MEPSNNSRRINDASNFHPQYVDNITQHFDRMYVSPFSLNTPFFPTPYIGNNYRYIWKQLETGSEEKAYVTHISGDGPASFYVMLQNDFENACPVLTSGIMNTLKGNIYEGIVPGKPCLAYDFNNILGRGMVMIVKDTKAEVFFVDYGYTREIPLTEIYDIPVEYVMSPSAMAIHVKLAKLDSKLTTEEGKKIFLDILNKDNFVTIRVTEREEPGKQFVELFLDDRGTLKNIKEKLQLPKFHKITLSKGNRYEVNISHCDSINVICVQLAASANVSSLQRLMSKLQSYCQNAGFDKCLTMDELYKGMPVCALFSDNKWYRAEILKTTNDPQAIPIAYVDYGNEELVSLESLKKIDPELIKFRAQAINCYLLADNDDLQENGLAFETYSDLVVDQKFVMEVTEVLRDMFIVQLTDENDIPVSELLRIKLQSLTEPEPALSIVNRLLNSQDISNKQKTRLLTGFQRGMKFIEFNPSIGFSNEVSVTWFANPRSFFVRIITEEFDDLIRDIQNTYDKREPLSEGEIHVNDCVVARSSDGFVHRGRITAVNESDSSDVTIFFVDLGEECSCKANEIWAISEEHCKIPVKTIYCGLKNISPPTGNDWLDETIDNALPYFSEADKYKLNIVGRFNDEFGTVNEVDLFDDKQRNVAVRLVNNSLARFNEGKKKNQQSNVTNSTTATDNEIHKIKSIVEANLSRNGKQKKSDLSSNDVKSNMYVDDGKKKQNESCIYELHANNAWHNWNVKQSKENSDKHRSVKSPVYQKSELKELTTMAEMIDAISATKTIEKNFIENKNPNQRHKIKSIVEANLSCNGKQNKSDLSSNDVKSNTYVDDGKKKQNESCIYELHSNNAWHNWNVKQSKENSGKHHSVKSPVYQKSELKELTTMAEMIDAMSPTKTIEKNFSKNKNPNQRHKIKSIVEANLSRNGKQKKSDLSSNDVKSNTYVDDGKKKQNESCIYELHANNAWHNWNVKQSKENSGKHHSVKSPVYQKSELKELTTMAEMIDAMSPTKTIEKNFIENKNPNQRHKIKSIVEANLSRNGKRKKSDLSSNDVKSNTYVDDGKKKQNESCIYELHSNNAWHNWNVKQSKENSGKHHSVKSPVYQKSELKELTTMAEMIDAMSPTKTIEKNFSKNKKPNRRCNLKSKSNVDKEEKQEVKMPTDKPFNKHQKSDFTSSAKSNVDKEEKQEVKTPTDKPFNKYQKSDFTSSVKSNAYYSSEFDASSISYYWNLKRSKGKSWKAAPVIKGMPSNKFKRYYVKLPTCQKNDSKQDSLPKKTDDGVGSKKVEFKQKFDNGDSKKSDIDRSKKEQDSLKPSIITGQKKAELKQDVGKKNIRDFSQKKNELKKSVSDRLIRTGLIDALLNRTDLTGSTGQKNDGNSESSAQSSRVTNKLPCQQKHSSSGGNRSDSGGKKKNSLQDKPKTQLKPGFPLGVQLTEMNLRKGYSLKVFNTFLVSPSLFCTRVVSDEFDEMMKTIQIEYQQREPLNIKMVHIGDHVMAKCFNGIIYRAQVVHINEHTFEGIKVVSVDYGNEFDCKKNEVWAISRDHSSVPIIGVYCSLRNILPPTGDSWAEEILNSAERYFTGEKQYKIDIAGQFKDCFGTIYEVDLFDDEGRNIAECLINDSLARPKEALTTLEEPIDLKTLVGQFVAVHVSWYESSKNFMVLPEFEKVSCIEETLLEIATDMTKLVKFSKEKIIQEALCLVYDEAFYRGLILSFNHISDEVTVHYIDYGVERKVSSDKLYILPRRLKCYQRQAFPCRLYGFAELSAEREEHLKQSVVNNNFIAYVNDAYDNRLSLTLNNEDGTILNIEEYKDTQPLDPLLPLTVMRPQTIVTVKNIMVEADGLVTAYVALSSDKQVLRNLQELLTNFYNEQRHIDRVEQCRIGSICAVKDSSDNRWLRCKILEKAATSVKVVCVDYGTEINVKYDSLFVLDKKLYYPNALSLKVGTGLKLKMITDDTLREFSQLTREIIVNATEFSTEFSRSNIAGLIWDVNIFYSERDDWPEALYRLCDVSETDRPDIERENIERWYRMGRVPLKVVHVVSPTLFWVQLADDSMAIDSLTNELEESLKLNLPASICDDPTNLKEQPFAVRNRTSTGGGPWYRATTERDRQNNSMIRSVDFGYSFEDAAEQLTIKTLPYSYRVIPHFAIRCSLNVEVTNLDEESAALDLFKRALVASEQLTGEIIVLGDETQTVRLFAGNDNNESDIAGTVFADRFSRRKRHEVYITEMESLDKFFTVNRKLADKMASRLNSPRYLCADNLTHRERNVGDMVLAKLPTCPDEWCRAIVCEFVDPDNYLIRVVDRGYLCYSNKSKRLPDRLRRVPPLAAEYSLDTSGLHINDCKQFDDIVNFVSRKRANVKFKMAVLSFTGEKSLAELYVNNNSLVRDIFGQSASDISENSRYSSYVSYIYSPAHFYVHFENVDTYAITEQLHNAIEEWQPLDSSRVTEGCVVAAQYRDNEWYRAKVLRVPLDGATDYCVRSIDFGDDFETSAIRELPEYLIRLPPLAIHCSLQPPEGRFTEWPESAKAEFDELTNCSETPFEMQVVAKGEPNLVSLRLDGTSVADRLLAVKRLALPTTKAADNHPDAQPVTEEDIVIEEEDYYSSEYLNNCSITNVVSLSEFYISNSICTEIAVNQLLEKCRNSLPNVKINDLVATVPDDGGRGLCRAKVLSTADGITADLLLIDSGKKTERCREFYALPNALIELPALAKRCSLIVPEQSGLTEWPPEAEQVFFARYLSSHSAFKEKLYRVKCETNNFRNDQLNHVQLWLGELDVANDVILHVAHVVDGLKQKSGRDSFKISSTTDSSKNVVNFVDESETSSFITASEGSIDNELTDNELLFDDESVNTIVQISFFDSPASFYVRRTNDTNPICIVEPLEPLDIFELNRLIAAQLNGQWCRAEVLSVTEDNRLLSVRRVDYGDIETVSANSVRKLPEQYLRKPAEAIHCALPGALAVNQWPEDALCKFKTEVISSLATIYEMEIIEKGHLPIIVDLMGIYSTQSLSSQFEKYFNATQ